MASKRDLLHMLKIAEREHECAKYIDNTERRNREVARYERRIAQIRRALQVQELKEQAATVLLPFSISVLGGWLFANLMMR